MPAEAFDLWWILIAGGLGALILVGAVVAATIAQQRRYLATVREFSGRLMVAHEEERAHIARELHDDLVQRVVLLGNEVTSLPGAATGGNRTASHWAKGMRDELMDLSEEIRRIAHRMHPSALDLAGLVPALEQLADETEQAAGIHIRLQADPMPASLKPGAALCLFRVAQEGIRNIIRHAGSKSASLRLRVTSDTVVMELSDRGAGFENTRTEPGRGLGLRSMEERLRLAGGEFRVHSIPGSGTTLTAKVPL